MVKAALNLDMLLYLAAATGISVVLVIISVGVWGAAEADETLHGAVSIDAPL
jgi:hypothetical protein